MSWSVELAPFIDWRLIAALGLAAAAVSLLGIFQRAPGAWLRAAAAALFVLALTNPAVQQEDREALPGVVAVVVDDSPSQGLDDRQDQTEAARAELEGRLEGINGLEPRWIEVGPGGSDGTELFSALERGLADLPADRIAGTILLTDGQVHDIPEARDQLGLDGPLHALITGEEDERDRRLVVEDAPRYGIVGEEQPVSFRVQEYGADRPDDAIRVTVRRDGEILREMEVGADEEVTVPVEIAHGGENIVEVEAEEVEGELTTLNNRAVITVDGIRENLRVLLVSGEPHAGERTWRNILKSDASVDLVHFTILRPPEKQDGTPVSQLSLIAFPTRELFAQKIDEFDLIIFDRYQSRGVLPVIYYDNIAQYVQEGGAVLVAAGPELADDQGSLYRTPLSTVLPARPTGNVVERPYHAGLSEDGHRHPITRELEAVAAAQRGGAEGDAPPWSRWFRLIDTADSSGDTLMTGPDNRPLLVVDREGEGRVAMLLSDHAWLWARGYEGGGPYVPLLRRMAHWLMKETDLEEEALNARHEGDRLIIERQTMQEEVGPVTVEMPSGEIREVALERAEPGRWTTELPAEEPGLHRIAQEDLSTLTNVGPDNPREYADVRSTSDELAPLVEETGGGVFRVGPADDISVPRVLPMRASASLSGSDWMGLRTTDASILHGVRSLPLFAGLVGLAILLVALSIAWYREGR